MKMQYLLIVGLILAILTIGAAGASQDADELAVDDDAGDVVSLADDEDVIAEDSGDDTIGEKEDPDFHVDFPEDDVGIDDKYASIDVKVLDSTATGNVTVKILDGENETLIYTEEIVPFIPGHWDEVTDKYVDSSGGNSILIKDLNLKPGVHNLSVSYTGDENFNSCTEYGTLTCYFMDVQIDDEITSNSFNIFIEDSVNGLIEVFIDNASFCNISTGEFYDDDGRVYTVEMPGLEYGHHTYKITFDGNYELDEPFEGEFNSTYKFYVSYEDYEDTYMDSTKSFEITCPADGNGEIIITYNGKRIVKKVVEGEDEGEYYVRLTDFALGENNITFTYNDSKYPVKSIVKTIYAYPRLTVPDYMRYGNEDYAISICMPSDATGNLVISVKTWNETSEDYDVEIIANESLVNGKANHTLTELGVGDKDITVVYDGDDYVDLFDESEYGVSIVPDVIYDFYYYVNATNSITVILPDDGHDNLTVNVTSQDGYYDDEKEIYHAVANGTVIVTLPKLEVGDYSFEVVYGDVMCQDYFKISEISPDLNLDIVFPAEITLENNRVTIKGIPEDYDGHYDLYIDGKLYEEDMGFYYDDENDDGTRYYALEYDEYGNHTWEIRFSEDYFYKDTSKNGTFFVDWIDIPSVIYSGEGIEVSLKDKEGYIELKIDGETYGCEFLDEGYTSFEIKGLSIANHTYEISYYDKNNVKNLTKSGSFKFDYGFATDIDEDSPYSLTDEFVLHVILPDDAKGTVTATVNGKNFTASQVDGIATIIIDNLIIGENNVTTSYSGDALYPAKQLKQVVNVRYGIFVKCDGEDHEIFVYVSIRLPEDADGYLTLYDATFVEEDHDIDDNEIPEHWEIADEENPVMSVRLVNGTAKISASDLGFGVFDLIARYVSALPEPDYEVDDVDMHFDIEPYVNITREIVAGENATVTVVIPNATGVINVYVETGYDDVAEEPIYDLYDVLSSVNGTFSGVISGLEYGEHCFLLEYNGTDMENMFNAHRPYTIFVEPKKAEVPENFSSDGTGQIAFELPEGSNGTVSVYVIDYNETTGKEVLIPLIENATYTSQNKSIAVSGLDIGTHELKMVYRDENGVYEKEATVNVPKPDAGADVVIPDEISGDVMDIKMPEKATGSVLVTIDGQTTMVPIVNGSAKVDLSNLGDGPHTVTVKYPGDGNYSGFTKSANMTVTTPVDPKITASDLTVLYTASTKYTATVYGTDGKVAANTQVVFLVNGKVYKTVTTDAKGVASVAITQKPGTYKITTKALGKEVTKTLKVKSIVKLPKVKVKRSAKKLVIKVTLAKVNGKYIKGKKVTLKFKNKKYTAKTSKKGVAKFTIKKKVLKKLKKGKKVTYSATYKSDTVKKTVKVQK